MRLSFKREKRETGLAGVARPVPCTQIKADGNVCGSITPADYRSKDNLWSLHFYVKDETNPGAFSVIHFSKKSETEGEMREFVKRNWEEFQRRYQIHSFEE